VPRRIACSGSEHMIDTWVPLFDYGTLIDVVQLVRIQVHLLRHELVLREEVIRRHEVAHHISRTIRTACNVIPHLFQRSTVPHVDIGLIRSFDEFSRKGRVIEEKLAGLQLFKVLSGPVLDEIHSRMTSELSMEYRIPSPGRQDPSVTVFPVVRIIEHPPEQ